jgi:hypothetical protein
MSSKGDTNLEIMNFNVADVRDAFTGRMAYETPLLNGWSIMVTICGRNSDDMFFLTRDGNVEITEVGYPKYKPGGLYHYARQSVLADSTDELDAFGRNRTDRLFIRLCDAVFGMMMGKEDSFKSLTCKKDGDGYKVLVQLNVEVNGREMLSETEGELANVVEVFEQQIILFQRRGETK